MKYFGPVELSPPEMEFAANIGRIRNASAHENYRWTDVPESMAEFINIEGAQGEMAVARYLGIVWQAETVDLKADDAGRYQVRTNTSRIFTDMALRDRDRPNRIYISCRSHAPVFYIDGWMSGYEGKVIGRVGGSPDRPPCRFVARRLLHPMDDLPPPEKAYAFDPEEIARYEKVCRERGISGSLSRRWQKQNPHREIAWRQNPNMAR